MQNAINLPESLKIQPINADTLPEFFSFIAQSPAQQEFAKLIHAMPDRQLAIQIEAAALDMLSATIERMAELGDVAIEE
jgi:hypothetical protein